MKKTIRTIGVLAGGSSNEREVSLKSGRAVYEALSKQGFDVVFCDVHDTVQEVIKKRTFDCAFIALHGKFGEDGTVQKELERAHIPYTGSRPDASRLALDKIASKEEFIRHDIPTPRYVIIEKGHVTPSALMLFGLPFVIKPQWEGSSIGLSVVQKESDIEKAIALALQYGTNALVEEYIEGRELTVGILDDKALPVIEIVPKKKIYDYKAKYQDPETQYLVPAPVKPEIFARAQELALKAHRALGCRCFSRVDMMLDAAGNMYVLEVNTIPGMTERSLLPKAAQAVGLDFNKLCATLVERALSDPHSKVKNRR